VLSFSLFSLEFHSEKKKKEGARVKKLSLGWLHLMVLLLCPVEKERVDIGIL